MTTPSDSSSLLQPGRHGGLGDAARFRRPAEMLLAGQGDDVGELIDHGRPCRMRGPAT